MSTINNRFPCGGSCSIARKERTHMIPCNFRFLQGDFLYILLAYYF